MLSEESRVIARRYLHSAALGSDSAVDTLAELAVEVLTGLGSTPEQVSRTLTAQRVRGHAADRQQNPLARYLAATLGAHAAAVDYVGASMTFTLDDAELVVEDIATPPAAAEFLAEFDAGRHEQLIDRIAPRPLAQRYLRSVANDMAGVETVTRGTVQEAVHRYGTSDPLPDDLIAAIAAAELDATDYASDFICDLRLYRDDLCVAMVCGAAERIYRFSSGTLVNEAVWFACAAYHHCSARGISHRRFGDRDEALRHVLTHLGETCRLHADVDQEVI
jgi:hypothetical protein